MSVCARKPLHATADCVIRKWDCLLIIFFLRADLADLKWGSRVFSLRYASVVDIFQCHHLSVQCTHKHRRYNNCFTPNIFFSNICREQTMIPCVWDVLTQTINETNHYRSLVHKRHRVSCSTFWIFLLLLRRCCHRNSATATILLRE